MLKIKDKPAKASEIYELLNKYPHTRVTVNYSSYDDENGHGSVKIMNTENHDFIELSDSCPFDFRVTVTEYGYLIVTGMGIQTTLTL